MTTVHTFQEMIGTKIVKVEAEVNGDYMHLTADDGTVFMFEHEQDCCEHVYIQDIVGDINDLLGIIVLAEEISSENYPEPTEAYSDSYTWTFYRFATHKGTVTVRWLGLSEGYYSVVVDFSIKKP